MHIVKFAFLWTTLQRITLCIGLWWPSRNSCTNQAGSKNRAKPRNHIDTATNVFWNTAIRSQLKLQVSLRVAQYQVSLKGNMLNDDDRFVHDLHRKWHKPSLNTLRVIEIHCKRLVMIIERWNNYTFGVPLFKYISKKQILPYL
jgi:hypothetical protein